MMFLFNIIEFAYTNIYNLNSYTINSLYQALKTPIINLI